MRHVTVILAKSLLKKRFDRLVDIRMINTEICSPKPNVVVVYRHDNRIEKKKKSTGIIGVEVRSFNSDRST